MISLSPIAASWYPCPIATRYSAGCYLKYCVKMKAEPLEICTAGTLFIVCFLAYNDVFSPGVEIRHLGTEIQSWSSLVRK